MGQRENLNEQVSQAPGGDNTIRCHGNSPGRRAPQGSQSDAGRLVYSSSESFQKSFPGASDRHIADNVKCRVEEWQHTWNSMRACLWDEKLVLDFWGTSYTQASHTHTHTHTQARACGALCLGGHLHDAHAYLTHTRARLGGKHSDTHAYLTHTRARLAGKHSDTHMYLTHPLSLTHTPGRQTS